MDEETFQMMFILLIYSISYFDLGTLIVPSDGPESFSEGTLAMATRRLSWDVVGPLRFYAHGDNRTFTRARPFSDDRWDQTVWIMALRVRNRPDHTRIVGHV